MLLDSNVGVLDKIKPIELVLNLDSFAGGENLVGEDHALKANECRLSQNWDALSLGGMERTRGFAIYSTAGKHIEACVFVGTHLDDATSGGTYTGTVSATYTIEIDSAGTPDTFKWKKNSGAWTSGVAITGSAQTLSDGVTITFGATTGHTATEYWTIQVTIYTTGFDLLIQHIEGANTTRLFGVVEGDLIVQSGSSFAQEDLGAFTSGVLCHAVSKGDKLWITNSTDGLKYKTIAGAIMTPADVPPSARDRIYYHKYRLVAEGGSKTVYGTKAGTGAWVDADAWSLSGDAWSIDLPDYTKGCAVGFPSGEEITVFTKNGAYALYNFPNVAFRLIPNSYGCSAPYSIAVGQEGVFFLSEYPVFGIILFTGVEWINLTANHTFINNVDLTKRIFGVYKDNKYYFIYNEVGSGLSVTDRIMVYDAKFGRWMTRQINTAFTDTMGYPSLQQFSNNELYMGSSSLCNVYEWVNDDYTADNTEETLASYTTKGFTSKDFEIASGGAFPVDDVRMKLIKATMVFYGASGNVTLYWNADNGLHAGSQIFDVTAKGDLINTTFTVNSSFIAGIPPDREISKSLNNSAVGRRFYFQINNQGSSTRPRIKRIKVHAIALEEY
jgi:hypothetical protein